MTELATETFGPLTWYGIDYGADMPRGEHHVPPLAALTPPGYISTYTGRAGAFFAVLAIAVIVQVLR